MPYGRKRAPGWLSRRSLLHGLAAGCGGGVAVASLLGGCEDESVAVPAADAGTDAAADVGVDVGADLPEDAGADVAADLSADVAAPEPDVAADLAPDLRRPGILSVPADDLDISARELAYRTDREARAYLAVPNRPGQFAGLVLIHDEAGLTEHIRDVARRFAKTGGCVALAPDLTARDPPALLADLTGALDTLAAQPEVGANRHGVVGFGWGGTQALLLAAATPRVRAAVCYYAPIPAPADVLRTVAAPVLGLYGMLDLAVNAGLPELERVLKEAGHPLDQRLYAAGHAFNDDTGPGYDEPAALAAWAPTIGWFEMYLG